MRNILYTIILILACCGYAETGDEIFMKMAPETACSCSAMSAQSDNDEDDFGAAMEGAKKLVCEDGRMYKLAYPANPPAGCSWQSTTPMGNQDEFGLAIGEMISSSVLPKSTQKAGTCMCIKAPCNCPQPPAPTKEVEELY